MENPSTPANRYRPLKIGPKIEIWPPVVLAPMAGVTNYPYRKICYEFGAGLCISEMVSARGLVEGNERTWEVAHFGPDERPRSLQIFGAEPEVLGEAVRRVKERVDHIDINFGCPAPKILKRGAGAAIPAQPALCRRVVRAAVKAADPVPVSIKVRLGLDEERFTFRDAGRIAEEEGCAYIGLHARTVAQRYGGRARWDYIEELKCLVRIPVLGNGDIWQAPDAFRMLAATGCDGVIIGRGCLGNPWLFAHLKMLFEGSGRPARPDLEEVAQVIRRHYRLLREHFRRPLQAEMLMRKFGTWYATGVRNAASLRRRFQTISSEADLEAVLEEMLRAGIMDGLPDPAEPSELVF
ncbi:MAG: tRNA dihydrouridine synthase DusB [Planctomycetes bacterium]|nr:tRNA dihydrouridine synthase DusB [Planctomycetota bacterium]